MWWLVFPACTLAGESVELVTIEGGSFERGAGEWAPPEERPERTLTIGPFEVMRSEVTRELFREIVRRDPSPRDDCGPTCPVASVSFLDAVTFANRLSRRDGLTPAYVVKRNEVRWLPGADGYRLLTEAEWEYVANAGTDTVFAGGADPDRYAWTDRNLGGSPHPVCSLEPNAFGLCDLSGNVAEWVWDRYDPRAYAHATSTDPWGPETGTDRVHRGGAFDRHAIDARITAREHDEPSTRRPGLGFRLARSTRFPPP